MPSTACCVLLKVENSALKEADAENLRTIERQRVELEGLKTYAANVAIRDKRIEHLERMVSNLVGAQKAMEVQSGLQIALIQAKEEEILRLNGLLDETTVDKDDEKRVKLLEKTILKLEKEGRVARKENYELKKRLGDEKLRKDSSTTHAVQMESQRKKSMEEMERLRIEKDCVIRGLRVRISELEATDHARNFKASEEHNAVLKRKVDELSCPKAPGAYEALLEVSRLMGEVIDLIFN